jgi:glycerol-3-phosphate acyltransferase PlsY
MALAACVVLAYLLGAVPFGLLIGLARGVDVREHGSRNIGATNVGRVVGRPWGYLCLALDIVKGLLPTWAAGWLLVRPPLSAPLICGWLVVALAAVAGHLWPIYLRFRGGKGVATTVGVGLGVFPYLTAPMLIALAGYAAARFTTGLVSVGSLTLAILFPVAFAVCARVSGWPIDVFWPLQAATVVLGLLIILRHAGNIRRLLRREEWRPSTGPAGDGPAAPV